MLRFALTKYLHRFTGMAVAALLTTGMANAQEHNKWPVYEGSDLGAGYTPARTVFKVWAPTADAVTLRLYKSGHDDDLLVLRPMVRHEQGTWHTAVDGDWDGYYYTYQAVVGGVLMPEAVDPYAKSAGVNGQRGMIYKPGSCDPAGWAQDVSPPLMALTDAIIYELHIRDATIAPTSGLPFKGTFRALSKSGGRGPGGVKTGLDHLVDLGVTHVHLLPFYDFASVDESRLDVPQYNWGYDPLNYNVPEGSYSTDPYDGRVRVRELKEMVMAFHQRGLRVVMDVVFNHTMHNEQSQFSKIVPGYYYRYRPDGSWSNGSGCGNETASEQPMMRRYMIESLLHWVNEYHIDGFRFDLMGLHDIETMNAIARALRAVKPDILLYGEGWTAGDSPLPEEMRAIKRHAPLLDGIAVFNDDMRDALKGSVFDHKDTGFASGKADQEQSVRFGIVAATDHPQVMLSRVNYSRAPYAKHPAQCINYVSCHDNHTLWDRLAISRPDADEATRIKMHLLAQTVVLTSQGIPFLHAGTDFLRTKHGDENSYKSPDHINQLDWARKSKYLSQHKYFKQLIALRKAHPMFRLPTEADVRRQLQFLEGTPPQVVAYTLLRGSTGDTWQQAVVAFNGSPRPQTINLPAGKWHYILRENVINNNFSKKVRGQQVTIAPFSALIVAR